MSSRSLLATSFLASALAVAAAACSSALGPEMEALEAARARWDRSGPGAYTFVLQRYCFCGSDFRRPVRIDVIDGVVIAAVYEDDGQPIDRPLGEIDTIPDLFDEIQDAFDRDAHQVLAQYDESMGYPKSVSIDFILEAIDEEMSFQVLELELLALPLSGRASAPN